MLCCWLPDVAAVEAGPVAEAGVDVEADMPARVQVGGTRENDADCRAVGMMEWNG